MSTTPARSELTVTRCLEAGLITRRLAPLPAAGPPVPGPDGLEASFSLMPAGDVVADLRFRCTSCATLTACCQALVFLARGRQLDEIAALDAGVLFARLPAIPAVHADRALLAAAALRAALRQVRQAGAGEAPEGA